MVFLGLFGEEGLGCGYGNHDLVKHDNWYRCKKCGFVPRDITVTTIKDKVVSTDDKGA